MTSPAVYDVIAGQDLISDLPDDLLLRILFFLPAASEVARTSVLSRRWRHLWPNAAALRFTVGRYPITCRYTQADRDGAIKLIAAATTALERRASGGDVEDLDLSFVYTSFGGDGNIGRVDYNRSIVHNDEPLHAADITPPHVAAWLRFAARHVTGRLILAVPRVPEKARAEEEEDEYDGEVKASDEVKRGLTSAELPCSARAREMILILGGATVTIPAAVAAGAFCTLTDVLLSHASMDASGDGARLGRLLSSSCSPRLRRLQLGFIKGIGELWLDAASTLEEIQLLHLDGLRALDVSAPGLCVLGIDECYGVSPAAVSAPQLQVLSWGGHMCHAGRLRFDGAVRIRRIEKLQLDPLWRRQIDGDGEDEGNGDESAAVWFLQHCTAVDWLVVHLRWPLSFLLKNMDGVEFEYEDTITKNIPHLPSVRNLKIKARSYPSEHTIAATVAKLIAKCTKIEDLTIELWSKADEEECSDSNCICNHPKGWESEKISLEHLRNVKIHNFLAFESQINLVWLLLTNTPALEKMKISLQMPCSNSPKVVAFHIPCYGGCWVGYDWMRDHWHGVTWARKYEWTRVGKGQEGERIHLDGMCIF